MHVRLHMHTLTRFPVSTWRLSQQVLALSMYFVAITTRDLSAIVSVLVIVVFMGVTSSGVAKGTLVHVPPSWSEIFSVHNCTLKSADFVFLWHLPQSLTRAIPWTPLGELDFHPQIPSCRPPADSWLRHWLLAKIVLCCRLVERFTNIYLTFARRKYSK